MKLLVEKVIQLETSMQEVMRQFDDFKDYLSKNFPEISLDKPHKNPVTDYNWIKNSGNEPDLPEDTLIDVKFDDGDVLSHTYYDLWDWGTGNNVNIIEYRISKE